MGSRTDLYQFEIDEAERTRRRQVRLNAFKTGLWWLTVIAVGFCAGLIIMLLQGNLLIRL